MRFHLHIFGWHLYIANYRMKKRNERLFDTAGKWRRMHLKGKALKRARGKCETCGKELYINTMQIHHIVPLSMSGEPYNLTNIQCLCAECHRAIHNNPLLYADQIREKLKIDKALIKTQ